MFYLRIKNILKNSLLEAKLKVMQIYRRDTIQQGKSALDFLQQAVTSYFSNCQPPHLLPALPA